MIDLWPYAGIALGSWAVAEVAWRGGAVWAGRRLRRSWHRMTCNTVDGECARCLAPFCEHNPTRPVPYGPIVAIGSRGLRFDDARVVVVCVRVVCVRCWERASVNELLGLHRAYWSAEGLPEGLWPDVSVAIYGREGAWTRSSRSAS